jgi:hypothetical protein
MQAGALARPVRRGGDVRRMASGNANVIAFPDLPPKGSRSNGGKSALMGPEMGTSFDMGQRLFAYYGEGDVFLTGRLRGIQRQRL